MSNLQEAAEAHAHEAERKYVAKRGGSVPALTALGVYLAAFNAFMANPERFAS